MISSELLRVKIDYKNNKIFPCFCSINKESKDIKISEQIIQTFQYSFDNKLTKEKLNTLLKEIENSYKDYKLIRGLGFIIERKCIFKQTIQSKYISLNKTNDDQSETKEKDQEIVSIRNYSATDIRRFVFDESAKQNIAISEHSRNNILKLVSNRINLSTEAISRLMWSDLDENMIIEKLPVIDPQQLLIKYNVALVQTLLFTCSNLRLKINSNDGTGIIWKRILWEIKKLGLMYWLETDVNNENINYKSNIVCIIEGPINTLKMTEKYGTYIAKLVPHIIRAPQWNIKAEIIKNTSNGQKKKYMFEISNDSYPNALPFNIISRFYWINISENNNNLNNINSNINNPMETEIPDSSSATSINKFNWRSAVFDSTIERIFMQKFELFNTNWKIEREPEPLITKQNAAFISDFVLTRYENKVYVEIVGFWTKEYLERKISKIHEILEHNDPQRFFMILIISYENLVSYEVIANEKFSYVKEKENVLIISYKKDKIPFKEMMAFLNKIEENYLYHNFFNTPNMNQTIQQAVNHVKQSISSKNRKYIDVDEIVLKGSSLIDKGNNNTTQKLSLRDLKLNKEFEEYFKKELLKNGLVLINNSIFDLNFIKELFNGIKNGSSLKEATDLLVSQKIYEKIHIDLLSFMGFNIEWSGLDYTQSKIRLTEKKRLFI